MCVYIDRHVNHYSLTALTMNELEAYPSRITGHASTERAVHLGSSSRDVRYLSRCRNY